MLKARVLIRGCLLSILLFNCFSIASSGAAPEPARWNTVNTPVQGKAGGWVLASGSDVQCLTRAIDGTLYAYGKGLTYTLYQSKNNGSSWAYVGGVKDNIVAIATAPDNASVIYYATVSGLYKSVDAGSSFVALLPNPGGAGSGNIQITSITVARLNNSYLVAVATRDTDAGQYGGVYLLDESLIIPAWQNTGIGSYDVYAVAFSPAFLSDRQLIAVATGETNTLVTSKIADSGWGSTTGSVVLNKDNTIPSPVAVANLAAIAFPEDYNALSTSPFFVGIDTGTGNGDAYKISLGTGVNQATDLNIGSAYNINNIDTASLDVCGKINEARLLAGAAASAEVYRSNDAGVSWTRSKKNPTGQTRTCVLMAKDYATSGIALAATTGTGSAFSYSKNGGETWNQVSLMDSDITTILELAVSPDYAVDNTLFMLTSGSSKYSLWRSRDGGTNWERTFSSYLPTVAQIDSVRLSPNYAQSKVVFLTGKKGSSPAIWKSTDNGETFSASLAYDPVSGSALTIDTWAVVNDNTLFIGTYDSTNGLIYRTDNSGFFYSRGVAAGSQSLKSTALSPNYLNDRTMLVGNTSGWVYWSNDNGSSFEPLPASASSAPLSGALWVAFDSGFSQNRIVYAASDATNKGVYRFVIGTGKEWERIDTTLPSGSTLGDVVVLNGTLYSANSKADCGMERSLNPAYSSGATFETVIKGLDASATLSGLWGYQDQVWSVDSTNIHLITFVDSISRPVVPVSPPDKAGGVGRINSDLVKDVILDWEARAGATSYQWQLSYESNFSIVPTGLDDETDASMVRLPSLEPGITYYWRVRVSKPYLGSWSARQSFSTSLSTAADYPKLTSPQAGSRDASLKPIFQWEPVSGASKYELLLSKDSSFSNPIVTRAGTNALTASAWECETELENGTAYYWKVRAVSTNSQSNWSAVSAFTTGAKTEAAPAAAAPTIIIIERTPAPRTEPPLPPAPSQTIPEWSVYLIGALLLIIILLLVIILVLVVTIRRI